MKTRQDLLDLFGEGDVEHQATKDILLSKEDQERGGLKATIDEFVFHLFNHYKECKFYLSGSPDLDQIPRVALAAKKLADFIGMEFDLIKSIEVPVEKIVEVEKEDKFNLGKVEAYEKLLIGRNISIEK